MDSAAFRDFIEITSSIFGIITFVSSVASLMLKNVLKPLSPMLGRMETRSRFSQIIFLGGFLATSAVLTGIVIAFLPVFGRVTLANAGLSNVALGNSVAVLGLILGLVSWLLALVAASRTRNWRGLVIMTIAGGLIYAGAAFYNDFSSYLLVGMVPSIFGLFGPAESTS